MNNLKIVFVLIYFGFAGSLFAQSISSDWEQKLANRQRLPWPLALHPRWLRG